MVQQEDLGSGFRWILLDVLLNEVEDQCRSEPQWFQNEVKCSLIDKRHTSIDFASL
jgi:hypothetical protein